MEIFYFYHIFRKVFLQSTGSKSIEQICTVQYHLQTCHESQSSDYIRKRPSIQNKNNLVLGDLTSQKQRSGFFLLSQLLLVSYLAGKNQTRTNQLHKYRKWIPRARESGVFTNKVWNCMFACCVCFCLPLRVNTVRLYCPLRPLFSLPLPSLSLSGGRPTWSHTVCLYYCLPLYLSVHGVYYYY